MNAQDVAPLILGLATIASVTGVILLRPLTKRLGDLLELMLKQRQMQPMQDPRAREMLERMEERLRMVEERQDFSEALITQRARARTLAPAQESSPAELRDRS